MPPRRFITFLSALVHAAILSTIFVTQLLSLGPLPVPRTVLAFSDALPISIRDIVLADFKHGFDSATPVYAEGFTMLSQTVGALGDPKDLAYADRKHYRIALRERDHLRA